MAEIKNTNISSLTACLLQRPRHKKIVDELKRLKVNIKFISDGDISGALLVTNKKYNVDIFLGIGGGPEGVLAAAALHCLGGQMQTRLVLKDKDEIKRAEALSISDLRKKYSIIDMVKGDVIFCATGITDGDMLKGLSLIHT